jgi:alanine racemase
MSKIMAVVKANAYGHGSVEVARHALENGITASSSSMISFRI